MCSILFSAPIISRCKITAFFLHTRAYIAYICVIFDEKSGFLPFIH